MVQKDTPGIPKGRPKGVVQDFTGDYYFIHAELAEFGKEREIILAATTAPWGHSFVSLWSTGAC